MIKKEKTTNNKTDFEATIRALAHRKTIEHAGLVKMVDYACKRRVDFCSTMYTSMAYFEYFETNLREQLDLRTPLVQSFSEKEMVGFMYDVLEVLSYLQSKKFVHGDIRPDLLFFAEENHKTITKLADRLSEHSSSAECQLNHIISHTDLYMSPELFHNLTRGKVTSSSLCPYKADAFSVGMLFLEMGTLHTVQGCYNRDQGEVSKEAVARLILNFQEKYSQCPLLCKGIEQLLVFDPKKRSDCRMIFKRLPRIEEVRKYYKKLEA